MSRSREEQSRVRRVALARRKERRFGAPEQRGEARLVELAKRGDKRAVGELYRRHVDLIYRYTYARVQDVAVAEDLTAQVFLKALEGLHNYRPTGAPFGAWLYRIAHARTVDYWRGLERRREVMLAETLPADDPAPEDLLAAKTEWDTVLGLLPELTDDQRDVIILRFLQDMSLAEVADMLDKTVGAVKALQHRALASMARLLEQRTTVTRDEDD